MGKARWTLAISGTNQFEGDLNIKINNNNLL